MSHDNICYDGTTRKWSNLKEPFSSTDISEMRNINLEKYDEEVYVDEVLVYINEGYKKLTKEKMKICQMMKRIVHVDTLQKILYPV